MSANPWQLFAPVDAEGGKILTGGVAANSRLRQDAKTAMAHLGVPLFVPPMNLTTDNAAMIGAAGAVAYARGIFAGSNLEASPFATIGV